MIERQRNRSSLLHTIRIVKNEAKKSAKNMVRLSKRERHDKRELLASLNQMNSNGSKHEADNGEYWVRVWLYGSEYEVAGPNQCQSNQIKMFKVNFLHFRNYWTWRIVYSPPVVYCWTNNNSIRRNREKNWENLMTKRRAYACSACTFAASAYVVHSQNRFLSPSDDRIGIE